MGEVTVSLEKLRAYVEEAPGYVLEETEKSEVIVIFQPHTEEAMAHMYGQSVMRIVGRVEGDRVLIHRLELEDDRGVNELDPESLEAWVWEVESTGE
jgi:hypothetical protein